MLLHRPDQPNALFDLSVIKHEARSRDLHGGPARALVDQQNGATIRKGRHAPARVHGEFERNDMVQYFGEQLSGFTFTKFGWVQSYGSRYVRPPILFGDVSRPEPMTVEWWRYASP